jgi:hypothetical protein
LRFPSSSSGGGAAGLRAGAGRGAGGDVLWRGARRAASPDSPHSQPACSMALSCRDNRGSKFPMQKRLPKLVFLQENNNKQKQ